MVAQHKRIDPIVGDLFRQEMADGGWWRHLLVSLPLAWCGLFVGQMWSIAMLPLFAPTMLYGLSLVYLFGRQGLVTTAKSGH